MTNEEKVKDLINMEYGYHDGDVVDYDSAKNILFEMAEWKDHQFNHITCGMISDALNLATEAINPWHKASEELPPYDKVVIVAYDGNTEDCCFNHRSNNPEVKTSENGWCDVGYDTEPTHWMEIPEIEED